MAIGKSGPISYLWNFANDYEALATIARLAAPLVSFIPVENVQLRVGAEAISILSKRLDYGVTAERSPSEREVLQFIGEYFAKDHPVSLIYLHSAVYEVITSMTLLDYTGSVMLRYHAVDLL